MNTYIIQRPMYHIVVSIDEDGDCDVQIQLTAKGRQYASARARSFHHFMRSDEEALAEIFAARDNFNLAPPNSKFSFDV